jgi:membrane-associated phospholipid phosphatase
MNIPGQNFTHELPLIRAIHTAVKGRGRYKVSGLLHSEGCKKYLELRLLQERIIAQVMANPLTGNVLVIFHPDFSHNAIANLIQQIVFDYTKDAKKRAGIMAAPEPAKDLPIPQNNSPRQTVQLQNATILPPPIESVNGAVVAFNTSASNLFSTSTEKNRLTPIYKKLDPTSRQIILLSGAVGSLIFLTGLIRASGLDSTILLAIKRLHAPLLDRIMVSITFLGEPITLLLISLASQMKLLHQNRRTEATTLSIAAVGAIGFNYLLKGLFGRVRPALWDHIVNVHHYSFPSGHAMVSIAIYGFISYLLAEQFSEQREEIFTLSALLIAAIGFSRLYLGVHWPTDVLAGYALGLVWLVACIVDLNNKSSLNLLVEEKPL